MKKIDFLFLLFKREINFMERFLEIKNEIKKWQQELLKPECDFQARTWIELQVKELKNERKAIKQDLIRQKWVEEYKKSIT